MFSPKDYLYTITLKRKAYFTPLLHEIGMNQLEAEILMFLHAHPKSNTLTDIISARDFTKSHASTAISVLEREGYLSKHTTENNKKTLRLTLLPKSEPLIEQLLLCVDTFQKVALKGISKEELDEMDRVLGKMCTNLKEKN